MSSLSVSMSEHESESLPAPRDTTGVSDTAKLKRKRSATMSRDEFKLISQSINEIRCMVRSTTDLLEKFKVAVSKPLAPLPVKKPKLSSYV
jgi:dihydroneopterin aldolase